MQRMEHFKTNHAKFIFKKYEKNYLHFLSILNTEILADSWNLLLWTTKNIDVSSHSTDLIIVEYSGYNTRELNWWIIHI